MKKTLSILLFSLLASVACALDITRHGVTWTISDASVASSSVSTGQPFANGDPWVVPVGASVTITAISPASTVSGGRTINGSMVNPDAGYSVAQGFDSAMGYNTYSAGLNAARPGGSDLSGGNPLTLAAGSSIVSTISHATAGTRPQLTDAAVLTVLASAPSAGAFRPPYVGTDKSTTRNKSQLNYGILHDLATVTGAPSQATVEGYMDRVWIEINTSDGGRYMHPSNNQPDYGREIADQIAEVAMWLNLNNSDATKETAYVYIVQFGIDVYAAAASDSEWFANGGHNQGRKMPMILAGLALNDSAILAYAGDPTIFQEDQQTFIIDQTAVDITNGPTWDPDTRAGTPVPYNSGNIGTPEWGLRHYHEPNRDNALWAANYRNHNYNSMIGHALVGNLVTGMRAAWDWEPFFTYHDRAKTIQGSSGFSAFESNMWNAYRNEPPLSGGGQTATPVLSVATGTYDTTQSVSISCASPSPTIEYRISTNGGSSWGSWTTYSSALSVSVSTVAQARANSSGLTQSEVSEATYTIACVQPAFSVAGASYPSAQTVTLSTTTSGASIYYTVDGSVPSASSTLYNSPLLISSSLTLRAITIKSGLTSSAISNAAYLIGEYLIDEGWSEVALPAAYAADFVVEFDASVSALAADCVIGLAPAAAVDAFADLACIVRFNTSNGFDARDGGSYTVTNALSYVGGTTYHFRIPVNMTANTYDVFITSPSTGTTTQLANDFAFRTEQSAAASLDTVAFIAAVQSGSISNFESYLDASTVRSVAAPRALIISP